MGQVAAMEQQHEDTQLGRPVALEMRRASWAPPPCRSNETDGLVQTPHRFGIPMPSTLNPLD